jgi:hypothetical protein
MPRDQARRYTEALWFSVVQQNAESTVSDGHLFHESIEDAWLDWYAQPFPHDATDDE